MNTPQTLPALPKYGPDEQNAPSGKFSIELLNALDTPYRAWRQVTAAKHTDDFFGQPIKSGETHYFRATGPGFDSCERLTALSMDRLLWLTFGVNRSLADHCRNMAEQRNSQAALDMAQAVQAISSSSL